MLVNLKSVLTSVLGPSVVLLLIAAVHADPPATQSAESAEIKEVRRAILDRDDAAPKMSLQDYRKTYFTQNDREAIFCDRQAHDAWEAGRTEEAVREKWGVAADAAFAHQCGFTSPEDDQVCHVKVDGDHAVISWDLKGTEPEELIKVDGQWLTDMHAMFERHLKENPDFDSMRFPIAKLFKDARADIDSGKFDDVDSFLADFKTKMEMPQVGN
jgi:hypothetical protein